LHRNRQTDGYGYIDSARRPDQDYMYFMGSVRCTFRDKIIIPSARVGEQGAADLKRKQRSVYKASLKFLNGLEGRDEFCNKNLRFGMCFRK